MRPTPVRHLIVLVVTVVALLLYLHRTCLSFLERYLKEDLHLDNNQVAMLFSVFFWTYALAQVPAGWLTDRFGARKVLAAYVLGWSLCTGLTGVAGGFLLLLLLRAGCGLAQAGAYPTSAALLRRWVPFGRRGLASSLVSNGGRLGGAIAPVLTAYLIVAFLPLGGHGWRAVLVVYGAAGVLVAAVFWLCFRDRPQEHPWCNDAEVELIEAGRPKTERSSGQAQGLPLRWMVRSPSLWLSSLAQFGTNFGWVFLLTWLPRYLEEVQRVPVLQRGWLASIPLLVGIPGQLLGGWLTDGLTEVMGVRWGRCLPTGLSRFVAMAAFAICPLLHSPLAVTAALSVVALATDLGTPATWAYMQDVGGRHVGSVLGWGNMWGNLGAALSPLVLNLVVERAGWPAMFLTCAAAFLVAGIAALGVDARVPIVPLDKRDG